MQTGQIVKALSGFYYIKVGDTVYQTRARGVFRQQKLVPLVGDFVQFQAETLEEGVLEKILPRKNQLIRPAISNVDSAIVVMSAVDPIFSSHLVDRFLIYLEANHIQPLLVITKTDLLSNDQVKEFERIRSQYEKIGYPTWLSSQLRENTTDFFAMIAGKTVVVMGQSGVGKSTLLNEFLPELALNTGEISTALGRGRHTTRHVALHDIHGALLADTPGFSTVQFDEIEKEQLPYCLPEFQQYSPMCKFRECLHVNEPSCAVKQAVQKGVIWRSRYEHYVLFLEEIMNRKPKYKNRG